MSGGDISIDVRDFLAAEWGNLYDISTATWVSVTPIGGTNSLLLEVSPDVGETRHYRLTVEEVTLTDVE